MSAAEEPHRQLRDRIAASVRAAILDGQMKPGQWLRQERLAHEYGVSQMPVREALKLLAVEGLVEHLPYRGARVVAFAPEDVLDLYAHRAFLEGLAAGVAATKITAEELHELHELHEQMRGHMDPAELVEYRLLNRRFHQVVFTASRRAYLIRTLSQIWEAFPTMLWGNFLHTAGTPLPQRDAADGAEHQAILDALEQGDSERAEQCMRQHVAGAGQQLAATLREHDGLHDS